MSFDELKSFRIFELYDLCRANKITGFKQKSKQEIFNELKNKNLLPYREIKLKPGPSFYYVLWYSNMPVMYSFTSFYKGMIFSGCDEKTIKKYDSNFIWNETDNSPKTIYVTNSIKDNAPNVNFFGRFPNCDSCKFNNYIKFKKLKTNLFHLNQCTDLGYIFNYMKDGCSLEVKFIHTFFDDDHVRFNGGKELEVILKTKYWFKDNKHFLKDEYGNFPEWGLTDQFEDKVPDLFGYIGYICMVDEIRGKYYSFVKEKNLSGRNYKVEYRFRFVPKDLWPCVNNIKYTKDVVECDFTDDMEKRFKNASFKEIEDYIFAWKIR